MVIEAKTRLVDVVVDVQTAHIDEPFTYTVRDDLPAIGSRVRVPLGGRVVSGWVVGMPADIKDGAAVKALEEICEDPVIPAPAVELARWIHTRYACTFREALAAVAPRSGARATQRFAFVSRPNGDSDVTILYRRYAAKQFSALGADRTLRAANVRASLSTLRRKLARLVNEGTLRRVDMERHAKRDRITADVIVMLEDASAAKGVAQRRLASALADAQGSLPLRDA